MRVGRDSLLMTFQARDYADLIDPVKLSGIRQHMTTNARSRAVTRLIQENRERYEEIRDEEREKMEAVSQARLEATRRRKGAPDG